MTPPPPDAAAARTLADRLLDAQVDFLLAELTEQRLPAVIAAAVDDALAMAADMVLEQVIDAEHVKRAACRAVGQVVGSPLTADLVEQIADAMSSLEAADLLGAVVARERVEALVAKLLGMRTLQERFLDRLADSPAVAELAASFASRFIADVVAQNRAMAQKLPGVSSLLSLGTSAASMVRNPLDQLLGDAAGRSAQYALRRTNGAARNPATEALLHDAALQVWDMHAGEAAGELRAYLADQDLRELAVLVFAMVLDARDSALVGEIVDTCVDVVFARYGQWDLASLLAEAGIARDDIVADLTAAAPRVIAAARRDGRLDSAIRARLEPFFHSDAVLAMLRQRPRPS